MTPQEQKEKIIEILEGIRGKWFQARFEKRLEWEKDRNKLADQILQALQPEIELDKATGTIHEKEPEGNVSKTLNDIIKEVWKEFDKEYENPEFGIRRVGLKLFIEHALTKTVQEALKACEVGEKEIKAIAGLHQVGDYIVGEKAGEKRGRNQAMKEYKKKRDAFLKVN